MASNVELKYTTKSTKWKTIPKHRVKHDNHAHTVSNCVVVLCRLISTKQAMQSGNQAYSEFGGPWYPASWLLMLTAMPALTYILYPSQNFKPLGTTFLVRALVSRQTGIGASTQASSDSGGRRSRSQAWQTERRRRLRAPRSASHRLRQLHRRPPRVPAASSHLRSSSSCCSRRGLTRPVWRTSRTWARWQAAWLLQVLITAH